jgi:hypothetical protein
VFTLFLTALAGNAPLPVSGRALSYRPDRVRDPFLDDGAPPAFVAQLYFDSLAALEAAAAQVAAGAHAEAMQVHRFAVPEPWQRAPATYCTYLVAYEGPADGRACGICSETRSRSIASSISAQRWIHRCGARCAPTLRNFRGIAAASRTMR